MNKILLALMFLWGGNVLASDAVYTGFFSNNAVSGYDTVAYFSEGKPVKGNKKYSTTYMRAKWLFSSADNLQKFQQNPKKYTPQYGGFCAWAVAVKNHRASGDPQRWDVVKGKLYLNYDRGVQAKWQQNISEFIQVIKPRPEDVVIVERLCL